MRYGLICLTESGKAGKQSALGVHARRIDDIFIKGQAKHVFAASQFEKLPEGDITIPEVAFIGRSNVGKSSLISALVNIQQLALSSKRPGKTRLFHGYLVGERTRKPFCMVDLPGYAHGSQESWGENIMSYLKFRRQFKRVFLMIDGLHGIKETDVQMVELMKRLGVPWLCVVSKIDRMKGGIEAKEQKFLKVAKLMEDFGGTPIPVSAKRKKGLTELRAAILQACGYEEMPSSSM